MALALCGMAGATALVPGPAAAAVELSGLSRTTAQAVRAALSLEREGCAAPPARIERLYRRADEEIRAALEVYGYYAAFIDKRLTIGEDCWAASFSVTRGPRTTLRQVDIRLGGSGARDPVLEAHLARAPLKAGEGLNQKRYEDFKAGTIDLARQRGYFEGEFGAARIDVWPEAAAADIRLEFDPGPRYRFGTLRFDQDVLGDEIVARYVEFNPGEPYDADQVGMLYSVLLASGYFQEVDIRTRVRPAPDRDVAIDITLTPSKPRTFTTGIGFATDTGPKVRAGYVNQRRNRAGHQLGLEGSASEIIGEAVASYRLPLGRPRDEWLGFDIGYRYERPEDKRSDLFRIGVEDVRRRGGDWQESRFLNYTRERFTVGEARGTSDLVIPGIGWSNRPVQSPGMRPREGLVLGLRLRGTSEFFGSDTAFLQAEGSVRAIRPLWTEARLLLRAEVGATARESFSRLPFSVRYFAGGDASVRGYDYKALGPVDDEGVVIGGAHKLAGSVEIDQRIAARWSLAAFVDMGNAFDDFATMKLKTSVGAGVRWYSPLGPVRFDVGVPLDDDAPDDFRIHVTLGPDL